MKLEIGNVIALRNGYKFVYHQSGNGFSLDGKFICHDVLRAYDENYEEINASKEYDIIRVYSDYTLKKVLWKREEIISEDEKVILRNIPKEYKYIARDKSGLLYVYKDKPQKTKYYWESSKGDVENLMVFNHLFECIKWEDEEPYLISDLLGED